MQESALRSAKIWGVALAMAGATFFLPVPAARAASLDGFLKSLRECDFADEATPFGQFRGSLIERYANTFSSEPAPAADRSEVAIAVPPDLAGAIGKATTRNEGEYTLVSVPLQGSFGGLAVSRLEFGFGNENGIHVATVMFAVPRAQVVKVFGAGIARGHRKGQQDGSDGAGYDAQIPNDEPGRIVCD